MTQKTDPLAGLDTSQVRLLAAKADCDLRTVRDELTVILSGGDSVSPPRARVRAAIRRMMRAGGITSPELRQALLGTARA